MEIKYKNKIEDNQHKVLDIPHELVDIVAPDVVYDDPQAYADLIASQPTFSPPGTRVHTYNQADDTFSIYQTDFSSVEFVALYERFRIFSLFYIDGATTLDTDDLKWTFYTIYNASNHMVGYVALYTFFYYPDKWRMRISQFVILPHHQRQGHGMHLYNYIMEHYAGDPDVIEVNVEDPNEAFCDLRDKCDLLRMSRLSEAESGPLEIQVRQLKLNKRQSDRCVEMLMLRKLLRSKQTKSVARMKPFRLAVKKRLFKHNIEVLAQIDKDERYEKLQETYESLIEDYERILSTL